MDHADAGWASGPTSAHLRGYRLIDGIPRGGESVTLVAAERSRPLTTAVAGFRTHLPGACSIPSLSRSRVRVEAEEGRGRRHGLDGVLGLRPLPSWAVSALVSRAVPTDTHNGPCEHQVPVIGSAKGIPEM